MVDQTPVPQKDLVKMLSKGPPTLNLEVVLAPLVSTLAASAIAFLLIKGRRVAEDSVELCRT
jgi:hypothetical protein